MPERTRLLLYGAYGYTGRLTAALAAAKQLDIVLSGRREEPLRELGKRLRLPIRAIGLDDADALADALDDVACVVHMAGPFALTSEPMLSACLATGAHYIDVTGEIEVFEAIWSREDEIDRAGITAIPGAGFDVVPSDCLAAYVASNLAQPHWLTIAIRAAASASQGTMRTAIRQIGKPALCRRGGAIVVLDDQTPRRVNFGDGLEPCAPASWGDVATAYHSTGIENITTYLRQSRLLGLASGGGRLLGGLLKSRIGQRALAAVVRRLPEGPSASEREKHRSTIWAGVSNDAGASFEALLMTPDPYDLTAESALEIATRVIASAPLGLRTPSQAFGEDFVLSLSGCRRVAARTSSDGAVINS
ncbi:MAG TPA: saccharopine dehydrogenase NADP-binding domain-containing protein [Gemmatimonadaceae bacterium]